MDWQTYAEAHARACFPREACGLVVIVNGRERFVATRNAAEGDDHFIISAEDYARAEDRGEIVGVFHSHCNVGPEPSEADLVGCEKSRLPWHIFALPTARWHSWNPSGYVAPLIGRQFHHGVLDCYALVRDWYAQERGIALPDFDRTDDWWHKGQNLYIENFRAAGFQEVSDGPRHGDGLLMQIASPVPNHAAVWLDGDMILHHLHGRLSSRDVYGEYFRKCTVKVLRYAA